MKKIIFALLISIMCTFMIACGDINKFVEEYSGGSNKKAFEVSQIAYDNINSAYEIVEQYGEDIYEAWRLGIYDKDQLLKDGIKYLASELSLSETELEEGAIYILITVSGENWSECSDKEKNEYKKILDYSFTYMKDDLFSFCVEIVKGAYIANGKANEIEEALKEAKIQMKELSDKYSDYEHYPSIKEYYTTTNSFFDFCQNPTGSFEQVKTTINDYRNEARGYINDLDYIFEE